MALNIGDTVPHFTATDQLGHDFDSARFLGNKIIVLYFYPKDDTPGCTMQACSFRDQYEDFKQYGAEVIGVSADNGKSHQKFVSKYQLPFTLLTDSNKTLSKMFGVKKDLFILPGRETFVIDKKGILQMKFDSMQAKSHITEALEKVKELSINQKI